MIVLIHRRQKGGDAATIFWVSWLGSRSRFLSSFKSSEKISYQQLSTSKTTQKGSIFNLFGHFFV
jgi:hypothetical protein